MLYEADFVGMGQVAHETVEAQWTGSSNGQATTDVITTANHISDVGLDPTYNTVGELLDVGIDQHSSVLDIVVSQFIDACLRMFSKYEITFGESLKSYIDAIKNEAKRRTSLIMCIRDYIKDQEYNFKYAKAKINDLEARYRETMRGIERANRALDNLKYFEEEEWAKKEREDAQKDLDKALKRKADIELAIEQARGKPEIYEKYVKTAWKRLVRVIKLIQYPEAPWDVQYDAPSVEYIMEKLNFLPPLGYDILKEYIPEAIKGAKIVLRILGRHGDLKLLEENEIPIRYLLSLWCNSGLSKDFDYKKYFDYCKSKYEKAYKGEKKKRKKQKPETQQPEEQQLQPQQQDAAPKRKGRKKKNTQPA